MDIAEIIKADNIVTLPQHPRRSATLYKDCIVCHPDDKEHMIQGLKGFFTLREEVKRLDENPTRRTIHHG